MGPKPGSRLSGGGWGVLSQGASAVGNLTLAVVVARGATTAEFGAWATAYVAYIASLTLLRAVVCTPMLIGSKELVKELVDPRSEIDGGCSAAVAGGLAVALLVGICCLLLDSDHAVTLLVVALVIPGLMLQDAVRHGYFLRDNPKGAAGLDVLWLVAQLGFFGVLILTGNEGTVAPTVAWGVAGLLSALVGTVSLGARPAWDALRRFFRRHAWSSRRTFLDAGLLALSNQAVPVVVAAVAGLSAAGALRAGQTLFGPVATVVMGLTPVATMELRKRRARGRSDRYVTPMLLWTAVIGGPALMLAVVIWLIPDHVGVELLGDSWSAAQVVLLPLAIHALCRPGITGPPLLLRAYLHLDQMVKLRLVVFVPGLLAPAVGAYVAGAEGSAWGLVVYAGLVTAAGIVSLFLVSRRGRAEAEVRP